MNDRGLFGRLRCLGMGMGTVGVVVLTELYGGGSSWMGL